MLWLTNGRSDPGEWLGSTEVCLLETRILTTQQGLWALQGPEALVPLLAAKLLYLCPILLLLWFQGMPTSSCCVENLLDGK